MSTATGIEWTDATWNPVRGCTRVSEGCRHCYAERMAARFNQPGQWGHGFAETIRTPARGVGGAVAREGGFEARWTGRVELDDSKLDLPLRWKKPRRIFVNSTSDLFHESLDDDAIGSVWRTMARCQHHTFQILTKRPERMREFTRRVGLGVRPFHHVWLGVSVEDQETADERIPILLDTPAAVRFISAEPLLGPVDLAHHLRGFNRDEMGLRDDPLAASLLSAGIESGHAWARPALHWVICGGESGPGARPMHPDWARGLRDQCAAAGVAFFMKQMGGSRRPLPPIPDDLMVREFPKVVIEGGGR